MDMPQVLSYGGGKQTVALCLLVERGILPRPDYIMAADTGREVQTTWHYLDEHIRPRMAALGLPVIIAGHDLASVDTHGHNGDLLLPVWTDTGRLSTYCSTEWKARVIQRKLREMGLTTATNWIGFSWDERKRVKGDDRGPWFRSYPLLDLMLTRADCEAIITSAGLPLPHKSRCFICPHQDDHEWAEVKANPDEWAQAVALDDELHDADERGGVYLHHSRVPLRDAELTERQPADGRQCGLGLCFL